MKNTKVLLCGNGWRAHAWAAVVDRLPTTTLVAVAGRDEKKTRALAQKYSAQSITIDDAEKIGADVVIVSVKKGEGINVARRFSQKGMRVLCETPAVITDDYIAQAGDANIGIAEQYPLQPRFAALREVVRSGVLGRVHTIKLSACHDYHAVALVRDIFGVGERMPDVRSIKFYDEYAVNGGREGRSDVEMQRVERTLAVVDYGDCRALYDFSKAQYFSAIRRSQITVQGTLGEITDGEGRYLSGCDEVPFCLRYAYDGQGGSLYPPDLNAIYFMDKKVYENRFYGLRLSEEEIAMAERLTAFIGGDVYSLGDGITDARIAALIHR